jgi:hypothetical protein
VEMPPWRLALVVVMQLRLSRFKLTRLLTL